MMMLIAGGKSDMKKEKMVGEILGRRKKSHKGCAKLETWNPRFQRYMGTVHLPAIDAIASCGYNSLRDRDRDYPITRCMVYYKAGDEWLEFYEVIRHTSFYEGAFFAWHSRLVLVGGTSVHYNSQTLSTSHTTASSVVVFEFRQSSFSSYTYDDPEDGEGSGDSYEDDSERDSYEESSGDGEGLESVTVKYVEEANVLVEGYGPGVLEACAVTLTDSEKRVQFLLTGGRTVQGQTLAKCIEGSLRLKGAGVVLGDTHLCSSVNYARRQHGCSKADIGGQRAVVVAGGQGQDGSPVAQVEYIALDSLGHPVGAWRPMGALLQPRFGFPSVGEVMGSLVVAGGRSRSSGGGEELDIDTLDQEQEVAVTSVEVWEESRGAFREAADRDGLGRRELGITRYDYYGVVFPRVWCTL